jgi:acyl-CoA synthetase (AMP-forming)/AMP-acid ligase II
MPCERQELASLIMHSGAQLGDQPLEVLVPAITEYCDQLQSAGVRERSIVIMEQLAGRDLLAAVLAAWQLDAVPLPCDVIPDVPVAQAAFALRPGMRPRPPRVRQLADGLGSTAVLHVSSGTTGPPKLARRSVSSLLMEAEGYRAGLQLRPEDGVFVPIPLTHSYGWGFAVSALVAGCAVVAETMVHQRRVARRIGSEDTTVVALAPALARLLAQAPQEAPVASPRIVMVGAGQVSSELDDAFSARFGVRLSRNYGSSETGPTFMGECGLAPGAIGRPMHGVEIVRPSRGQRGELHLRLSAPVEGYLGETAAPAEEWRTGDLVYCDQDDVVHFLERLRPALRVNGRSVDANPLERLLRGVPGVEEVYLLSMGRPAAPETEDLYAVIGGIHVDDAELRACRSGLPPDMPPLRIVRCASLPHKESGKPDRDAICKLIRAESHERNP